MRKSLLTLAGITAAFATSTCADGSGTDDGGADAGGYSVLTRVSAIATQDECTNGGVVLDYGIDENGNGELDDDEVDGSDVVCNGEDGQDGTSPPAPLVEVNVEPAGPNCADGGVAVTAGLDLDESGYLEPSEVTSTTYVCNGSAGPAGPQTLVDVVDEPPGLNCENGGKAILTGTDDDGSGTLDVEEVDDTVYVCTAAAGFSGVLEGSYTIANSLDAAMIANVTEITGNLEISADGLVAVDLPQLEAIGGDLYVRCNDDLLYLGLDSLLMVGGNLIAKENVNLVDLLVPNLSTVGGYVEFEWNEDLLDPSVLASLTTVGGDFVFRYQNSLSTAAFSALRTVAGEFRIATNQALTSISAPLLETTGAMTFFNNPQLGTIQGFPALGAVDGTLEIQGNDALTEITGFNALTTVGGGLHIWSNGTLTSIGGFAVLSDVTTALSIRHAPALFDVADLTNLTTVGRLVIEHNDNLGDLAWLGNLTTVSSEGLFVRWNDGLATLGLASLTTVVDQFAVYDNPALPTCEAVSHLTQLVGFTGPSNTSNNDDPCDPDPCGGTGCTMDCSAPDDYVCN